MQAVCENGFIRLKFPYDENIVKKIKTIPGRRYDSGSKTWLVPVSQVENIKRAFDLTEGCAYPGEPLDRCAFFGIAVDLYENRLFIEGPSSQKEYFKRSMEDLCGFDDKNGRPKTLAEIQGDSVTFPKGLYFRVKDFLSRYLFRRVNVHELPKAPSPQIALKANLEPRPYQEEALNMIKSGDIPHRAVLVLPTGAGKTALAAMIAAHLGLPTVFYTYSVDLTLQTKKNFEEILQIPVGIINGSEINIKPVTVATVQSVISKRNDPRVKEFLSRVETMFVDEGHMLGAETVYMVSHLTDPYYAYALTATPKRSDGRDICIEAGAGPVYVIKSDTELVGQNFILPVKVVVHKIDHPPVKLKTYRALYKKRILSDRRNKIIAEIVKRQPGRILVLVKEISHGENLASLVGAPFVHGATPASDREKAIGLFQQGKINTLVASNIFKQGIDIPEADTLVLAHGGSSETEVLQKIGRVRRVSPGKSEARVIDFCDADGGIFEKQFRKRLDVYSVSGFQVEFIYSSGNF